MSTPWAEKKNAEIVLPGLITPKGLSAAGRPPIIQTMLDHLPP